MPQQKEKRCGKKERDLGRSWMSVCTAGLFLNEVHIFLFLDERGKARVTAGKRRKECEFGKMSNHFVMCLRLQADLSH